MSRLDPQVAWFVWGVGIALVVALLALIVRALLRPAQPASPDRRVAAELEALRLRVDSMEHDLQAFDASYNQLSAQTAAAEKQLERMDGDAGGDRRADS